MLMLPRRVRQSSLTGLHVESDHLAVQRVEDVLAESDRAAAIHNVAARDALAGWQRLGGKLPLQRRAGLGEIERIDIVRIGGDDVHGVVDDDRRRLLAFVYARAKRRTPGVSAATFCGVSSVSPEKRVEA